MMIRVTASVGTDFAAVGDSLRAIEASAGDSQGIARGLFSVFGVLDASERALIALSGEDEADGAMLLMARAGRELEAAMAEVDCVVRMARELRQRIE
ncbi:hypothetical protein GZ998_03205 [Actinomyces sp. 594]|uniref:hypothetical protein n=1 Tax=Actinomyces sp. 594 TaxID=2057793 RepID=UPI001C59F4FC|nr:hypothetical protein [Actinomyces sp. 594]MBW3068521.1 hypothetical protein [Actinomyces sp. 594]